MHYRRFGRTELQMPVFSCGGMRYQQSWQDVPEGDVKADGQANLEATIHRAVELGINHIETARGYGSSEMQLGWVLPGIDRKRLIIQTKVSPREDAAEFRSVLEKSLAYLQLDYIDLFAIHGLNTRELLDWTLRPGGCMDVVRQMQRDGRIRFVGFSTHGPREVIVDAIETGEFDYVNLHWYWINQRNWPAIQAARRQDMGVFIISPNDKGGRLYDPPARLTELCDPLDPMAFNDLFCLLRPEVHTLSLGASKPEDFDVHVKALDHWDQAEQLVAGIEARLVAEMDTAVGAGWQSRWMDLPEPEDLPGGIQVREILRLNDLAKGLGLETYASERYNILGNGGHWVPGQNAAAVDDAAIKSALGWHPLADRIPDLLRAAHSDLYVEPKKRQSEG